MQNLKSILKQRCPLCLVFLALVFFAVASDASPQVGSSIKDAEGQVIGTINATIEASENLTPAYVISLPNGGYRIEPASHFRGDGGALVLTQFQAESSIDPMLKDIRSMTMVMVMESHDDVNLLTDIQAMNYTLEGEILHISGSMSSIHELERLVRVTADLCDYKVAPHILIRPQAAS